MRARRPAAALLAAIVALPGCSAGAAAPDPPSLSGELTQYRRDQPRGLVQVTLRNDGPVEVVVERLRLEAPGFPEAADTERSSRLAPGTRVDLPVPHGRVDCAVTPPAGRTDGVAVAQVRRGQDVDEVRVPLSAEGGVLALVRRRLCAQQALDRAVAVSFADAWPEAVEGGRPVLRPTLVLERRAGSERVVVQDAGGHVLFTVRPRDPQAAPPLLVLEPDQARAELLLDVVATRCDGHALAESKRTPLFLFYVGVGDDEPRLLPVTAPTPVHAQLAEFATRSCRG